ncbi:MBOAT family O-acyltransferase [Plastoroseomonas hellenica]|uniref:MBOAT family O-acyltransferase n=1 Tax=Plastoroseomonas hellenica TaxID=2687306 RepID=UPI001BA490AC|nr:MBOAT family protein [Plastoroseomonas hellenica]MBR0645839.1 MBOAT family protein [Plastoroseomonas hellenica]
MLFNSQALILGLLPIALAGWYAAPTRALRQIWAIGASLVFYGFWDIRFVPVLVALTLINWAIGHAHERWPRGIWPILGILLNLGLLAWVKYANFFAENVAWLAGGGHEAWDIILPLGVSFFVFQKIAYLVDLRRGKAHAYPLLDFALFVTFFPQLVAGPLVRHNEIIHQFALDPRRPEAAENLTRGAVLFIIGLAKKVLIADTLAPVVDRLFTHAAAGGALNLAEAWAAAGGFALQIYFDFSGYSDMAIGLALMFGLLLPANFDAPYRATSIRDFWRRWHMTLSRFLRDYVYIPLGGNRGSGPGQAVNVVATMLLGGLWHGAAWTFVAWGGLHGLALAVNGAWNRAGLAMPRLLGWALTLLFVIGCWVLFRAPDFPTAAAMLQAMVTGGPGRVVIDNTQAAAAIAGVAAALLGPASHRFALEQIRPRPALALPVAAALVYLLLITGGRRAHDFIYFQF